MYQKVDPYEIPEQGHQNAVVNSFWQRRDVIAHMLVGETFDTSRELSARFP